MDFLDVEATSKYQAKQVEATHATHATHAYHQFAVKPLLRIIEDIFKCAAPGFDKQGSAQLDLRDDKTDFSHTLYCLSSTINKVSCEISCKCYGGGDEDTVLGILGILEWFDWDEKVALAMAAFALNCGEFRVMARLSDKDPLVKSVALLKQLPEIYEREQIDTLKSKLEALSNLIKTMLDVTKCIVELKELPAQYISPQILDAATPYVEEAVKQTIRSILACAAQIMGPVDMTHRSISRFAVILESEHTHLKEKLDLCYRIIDEKKGIEEYEELKRLMEETGVDYMKVLRALIYAKDGQQPLVKGSNRTKQVSVEVLSGNNVLLLISHPDASLDDELFILKEMYQESRQNETKTESQYEVVWMPVLDKTVPWTEEKKNKFETLQSMMPWYSIYHPSMVGQAVIRYIEEFWNFKKKQILVVLDLQGKVVNTNALHMIWIWGSLAFPFSFAREEALWTSEKSWGLELLVGTIDPIIPVWVGDRKFICLYGGEDIVWIQNFIKIAKAVAKVVGLPLEMIYVGKSNPKDKVKTNQTTITAQKLSRTLKDIPLIRFFWVRLESMWHSKLKHCKNVETDLILQEIVKMLTFDGSEGCWAFICRGSEIAKAKGETILKSFEDFNDWKKNANDKSFIPALNERLHQIYSSGHCNCLILPETTGPMPESLVCYECKRPMEEFIMYRCCNE